jgi:GNAT superfamily N-acetyltransferase
VAKDRDGTILGYVIVGIWDDGTNEHLVWLQLAVRNEARRQGIARSLLRLGVDLTKETGRTLLTADTMNTIPAGTAFSEVIGAEVALREVTNAVATASIDRGMLEGWRAAGPGRAPGYEVIVLEGGYPDDFLEDIARLFYMAEEDMPFEDLDMEPMVVTAEIVAERVRQLEGVLERTVAIARHEESGRLVGFSGIVKFIEDDETLHTGLTVVDRDHRGFALGKWIKAAVILRVLEKYPDAERLVTENAASNAPMLGINTEIGFTPAFEMVSYQATVDVVEAYLSNRGV